MKAYLSGGLGNQLYSLAASFVIATEYEQALIVSAKEISLGSNYRREFELSNMDFGDLPIQFIDLKPFCFLKYKHLLGRKMSKLFFFQNKNKSEKARIIGMSDSPNRELEKFKHEDEIRGHFIHSAWYEEAVRRGFPDKLRFFNVGKVFTDLESLISDDSISVHVRLGDYLQNQKIFPIIPESYYLEAITRIRENGKHDVFLFSDSPQIVRTLYPKLYSLSRTDFLEAKSLTALETLKLMSLFKYQIISNSTFSTWAALFSQTRGEQIYTPIPHMWGKWVDHLPSSWNRIHIN
jgi:hypothetical protein